MGQNGRARREAGRDRGGAWAWGVGCGSGDGGQEGAAQGGGSAPPPLSESTRPIAPACVPRPSDAPCASLVHSRTHPWQPTHAFPLIGSASNTPAVSIYSPSGTAGGASGGCGLGRGAAGPGRRCSTAAAGALCWGRKVSCCAEGVFGRERRSQIPSNYHGTFLVSRAPAFLFLNNQATASAHCPLRRRLGSTPPSPD